MIAGVADEQIAITNSNAMGTTQLPWTIARAAKARNRLEDTVTRVKALQLSRFDIQQVDAAVGTKRHICRGGQPTKASPRFRQRRQALRQRGKRQALRTGERFNVEQFSFMPACLSIQQPPGGIVRWLRNRRKIALKVHHFINYSNA